MQYEEIVSVAVNGVAEDHRLRFTFELRYMSGRYVPIIVKTEEVFPSGRVVDAGDFFNYCPLSESNRIDRECVKAGLAERGMTVERATCLR